MAMELTQLEEIFSNPDKYEWIPDEDVSQFELKGVPEKVQDKVKDIHALILYTRDGSDFLLQAYFFDQKRGVLPWFFGRYRLEEIEVGGLGAAAPEKPVPIPTTIPEYLF